MARGDLKTGRTGSRIPFQILADYYQAGDTHDRDLWHEYSRVTRGLAAVRWSRGLRTQILGSAAMPQRTDAELASEEVSGELLTAIGVEVWWRLRLAGLDLAVLVAAESGGLATVNPLVRSLTRNIERPRTPRCA